MKEDEIIRYKDRIESYLWLVVCFCIIYISLIIISKSRF